MSGHSKWAQIKRKKAVTDSRRGQLFTRLLKEITVAARLGGGDPEANPRLRLAVQRARAGDVPNDNIERAIKKGTGALEGMAYEDVSYEGYGPGGVAILVEAVTDNRNRTVSEIRHLFSRHGGSLGENGCVSWMFDTRGYFALDKSALSEEGFMELALELGADDISVEEEAYEIHTTPEAFPRIREALRERQLEPTAEELERVPSSTVEVEERKLPQVLRLLEALEEHDDVQNVWANLDADAAVLAGQAER